jgi:hypothetical protein
MDKRGDPYTQSLKVLGGDVVSPSFVVLEHWPIVAPDIPQQ